MSNLKMKDFDGNAVYLEGNGLGTEVSPFVPNQGKPFNQAVADGDVEGYTPVNKFGHNIDALAGDTVWGAGGVYEFFPTTAQKVHVVSTSTLDTSAGDGARLLLVSGLDENWEYAEELVTLSGTTPSADLLQTFIRINRCFCLEVGAGATGTNVGDITVVVSAGEADAGTVAAFIDAGDGQTQMAVYTIPAGATASMQKWYVELADDAKTGELAEFQWQTRINDGSGVHGPWRVRGEVGLNALGSATWTYEYATPVSGITERTDIRIVIPFMTSSSPMGAVGGFDLILRDN